MTPGQYRRKTALEMLDLFNTSVGMHYAGIGSRETPQRVRELMSALARLWARSPYGHECFTGGAAGADWAFMRGVAHGLVNPEYLDQTALSYFPWDGVSKETLIKAPFDSSAAALRVMLPWDGYNGYPIDDLRFFGPPKDWAFELAGKFHPAWDRCSAAAKKLHARNAHIIYGYHREDPISGINNVDLVVCWTPEGKIIGGTGQALRMAMELDIPTLNLGDEEILRIVDEYVLRRDR